MRRIYFLAICTIFYLQSCSQIEKDKTVLALTNTKLLSFELEQMPNSKYKYRTVFVFQDNDREIVKMNVPCDSSMKGTFVIGNYHCSLDIDSVYQIQLQKTTLKEIPINLKNSEGFFYTTKYVEQIDNSSKFRYKSNVNETEMDKIQLLSDYVDVDNSIFKIIGISPNKCSQLRN